MSIPLERKGDGGGLEMEECSGKERGLDQGGMGWGIKGSVQTDSKGYPCLGQDRKMFKISLERGAP